MKVSSRKNKAIFQLPYYTFSFLGFVLWRDMLNPDYKEWRFLGYKLSSNQA